MKDFETEIIKLDKFCLNINPDNFYNLDFRIQKLLRKYSNYVLQKNKGEINIATKILSFPLEDDYLTELQNLYIQEMNAYEYQQEKFYSKNTYINNLIKNNTFPIYLDSVRIFYLSHYDFSIDKIRKFITHIPLVAINGDYTMESQDFQDLERDKYLKGKYTNLINPIERQISRKKIIAHYGYLFANGGYYQNFTLLNTPQPTIFLTAAGPQFEVNYLEYKQFFKNKKECENCIQIVLDNKNLYFNSQKYYSICFEDIFLILKSFNEMVGIVNQNYSLDNYKKGYLQVVAIGMGFFAKLLMEKSITNIILPIWLKAFEDVLKKFVFENIAIIEFLDFMKGKFTPSFNTLTINNIKIISSLDNMNILKSNYIMGLLNPGDVFAIPGNERGYQSVESMIGNNSDLRLVQSYVFNKNLLNSKNYISVDIKKNE
jgi:hypothetical protein